MKLTPEQIVENWEKVIKIIHGEIALDKRENLLKLYHHFQDRMLYAPASGKDFYHGAYPGGYLKHVIGVHQIALDLDGVIRKYSTQVDYTLEELVFTAINHDLGKIGDLKEPYFVEHNERWRKERGELYIHNPNIENMQVPHRSLWLLSQFDVKYNQKEMIAILLHDGMYDEGNKAYLVNYTEDRHLRSKLPTILHQADMLACQIEKDEYKVHDKPKKESNVSFPKQKLHIPQEALRALKNSLNGGTR